MQALTMDSQLTIPAILCRTRTHFGDKRVVGRRDDGSMVRTTFDASSPTRSQIGGCPDAIVFLESLPKTGTGKFLKTALREQFRNHYGAE